MFYNRYYLISFIFLFFGCKPILLKIKQIKQPEIETKASLTSFLKKNGFSSDIPIYAFKNVDVYNKKISEGLSMPDANFFNSDGCFVNYQKEASDCNGKIGPFMQNSEDINGMDCNHEYTVDSILENIVLLKGQDDILDQNRDYNSYIVIYWAKFLGKLNKEKALDWINIYKEQATKSRLIFLNCDYQDFWGLSKKDLPKFDY